MPHVFVTGGTGYMGRPLIATLLERGHHVRALVRAASRRRLPAGAEAVVGNALDASTYPAAVSPADTFVHLVGTPRPNPAKARQFEQVDLASVRAAVDAARAARVAHFVYVSVAQPAPVMRAYIAVRQRGEQLIRESGMNATVLRPWYVLGPGHGTTWLACRLMLFPPIAGRGRTRRVYACHAAGAARIPNVVRWLRCRSAHASGASASS